MKNKLTLVFILFALTFGCKKDAQQISDSVESTTKIESDPLFLQWGKSANGRWIRYSLEIVDKNTMNKDNVFQVLNSSVEPVYNARKYYEHLLLEKYGDGIGDFNVYLDSLYRKNYDRINSSLDKRKVMDDLYLQYGKLGPSIRASKLTASAKMSLWDDGGDLPEVIINACNVPRDLVDFYRLYLDPNRVMPFEPVGPTQQITDCFRSSLNEISNNIRMLKPANNPGGTGCAFYASRAYDAMLKFNNCDILNPFPGTSPSDPFPPGGGIGGGAGGDPGNPPGPTSPVVFQWDQNGNFDEAIETESELEIPGIPTKNPAKIVCSALLHCSANMGSGVPLAVVESADMSMTVVNGSSTALLPDGTADSWYTTLSKKFYDHSPYGFPTVTLTWNAIKNVTHTVTKPGQSPVTKVTQKPVTSTRVMSAYLPSPL